MAAPTHTARGTPSGIALKEGFSVEMTFALRSNVSLWCKSMKPLSIKGGEPIDTTTQKNSTVKTRRPRVLHDYGPTTTFKFTYDPNVRSEIEDYLINREGSVTQWWPDQSYEDFYGFLVDAEFDEMVEGELPTGTGTVCCSNWDPTNNVEVKPVFVTVSGT